MKRIISIILVSFVILSLGLSLAACADKDPAPEGGSSGGQAFLAAEGGWEKEGDPAIKLIFNQDGTGKMTANNGRVWRELTWVYDEGDINLLLAMMVIGSREVSVDWVVEIDKKNGKLELVDLMDESKVVYVKAGSQNVEAKVHNRDEKLDGIWYSSHIDPDTLTEVANAYCLQMNDALLSGYGRFDISGKTVDVQAIYTDWYTEGDKLNVVMPSGVAYEFTYKLNGERLELYRGGELIRTLEKAVDGKIK